MGKSFAEYQAEHLRTPFELPMPDGSTVPLAMASIEQERAVDAAVKAAGKDADQFTGLDVVGGAGAEDKARAAWGTLPPEAWKAVLADMREHFGRGKSVTSPPS